MYPDRPLSEALERISSRRSVKAMDLQEPGPSPESLNTILDSALRVPDHGKLGPWRLVIFQHDDRAAFGDILAARWRVLHPDANEAQLRFEQNRFMRAPVVIAVISERQAGHKIPEWEQILSAGAVCQNLLVAASLAGFAAQWLTEWYAYDDDMLTALGGTPGHDQIAGFIYIGEKIKAPMERTRPDPDKVITYL